MKQQAKNVSPWKLGSLLALSALLFTVFACSEEPNKDTTDVGTQSTDLKQEIFTIVESQPEYKGGIDAFRKYLMTELRYPLKARQMGVEGSVQVEFVVEKDGSVSEAKAVKGIGAGCDDEAVRVLKNTQGFTPGTQNGKPVRVRMAVPVVFKLNKGQTNPDNSTQGIIIIDPVESRNATLKVDASYANGEWYGTVYDEHGERLPGANVIIVGTTKGTSSDLNGKFKVKADESSQLNVSFIGYESVRLQGTK
jgi:TonB family protein